MTPTSASASASAPRGGSPPPRRIARLWPQVLWLWLLWIVLWGSVSPVVLLCGAVVAVLVPVLFPLPPVTRRAHLHPLWLLALPGHLLVELVGSALIVAREAVLRGPRAKAAVLEVPLWVESDLMVSATASLASLTPGTLVLEIDRDGRLLYVHALPVRDKEHLGARRDEVVDAESWVVRVFGPSGARGELDRWRELPKARGKRSGEGTR
ncbi:Na+/H+ antiporter subunit E [Streptomyces sp. TRM 70361]|uniref:Na+/H+ antiporter subunit E n=1 Tax=Streptomyces sp. TRM 70361 TaxID=3116553 RepID=UPI002E7AFFB9|nr:Na+/H+ antiporter subunit E [Streptomyces sp. TRM 70361]MEE1942087.1 Na+/H+ antiporter subunit E [Streptomyces sp. TRM 70361]